MKNAAAANFVFQWIFALNSVKHKFSMRVLLNNNAQGEYVNKTMRKSLMRQSLILVKLMSFHKYDVKSDYMKSYSVLCIFPVL